MKANMKSTHFKDETYNYTEKWYADMENCEIVVTHRHPSLLMPCL